MGDSFAVSYFKWSNSNSICFHYFYHPLQYPLGYFPEDLFDEEVRCKHIKDFQEALEILSSSIEKRNTDLNLTVPYTYLCPVNVDNSIAI